MRALIAFLVSLVVLVAVALILLPRWVDRPSGRAALTRALAELAGTPVTVQGPVEFDLLPRPTFTFARLVLGQGRPWSEGGVGGEIARVDLELAFGALLRGDLEIANVRVVRPELAVRGGPAALASALVKAEGIRSAEVIGGRLSLLPAEGGLPLVIEELDLLLRGGGNSGSHIEARARVLGERAMLRLDSAALRPGRRVPLAATLSLGSGGELAQVDFDGTLGSGITGGLVVRLRHERGWLPLLRLAGLAPLPAPPVEMLPLVLHTRLDTEDGMLALQDTALEIAGRRFAGDGTLRLSPFPEVELRLRTAELTLPQLPDPRLLREVSAIIGPLAGRIEFAVGTVRLPAGPVHDVEATLVLPGDGQLRIERAGARLAGSGTFALTATLPPPGVPEPSEWRLQLSAPDLRGMLAAFDVDAGMLPEGMLRTATVDATLRSTTERIELVALDLALDATRLTASGALLPQPRPQLDLQARITRLELDPWLALWSRFEPSLEDRARWLGAVDARLVLSAEKLSLAQLRADAVTLHGRLDQGALLIEQLAIEDVSGTSGEVAGSLHLLRREFDLAFDLRAAAPARLARSVGIALDPTLAALAPLAARGFVRARGDALEADVTLAAPQGTLRLSGHGEAAASPELAALDARLDIPDLATLAAAAGVPLPSPAAVRGPVQLEAALVRMPDGALAIDGGGALPATPFSFAASWREREGAPPLLAGHLALEQTPTRELADVLYRLAQPFAPLLPSPPWRWPGAWPPDPVFALVPDDWAFELSLGVGEDLQGLRLVGADGELRVERVRWPLADGTLTGALTLRETPAGIEGEGSLRLENVALAELLGAPRDSLAGRADLELDFASRGTSFADWAQRLFGDGRIALRDLRVGPSAPAAAMPLPLDLQLAAVSAVLRLRRGLLETEPEWLVLPGPPPARLSLRVDLYAWMVDLRLGDSGADAAQPALRGRLFGPLGRPVWQPLPAPLPADASVGGTEHVLGPH